MPIRDILVSASRVCTRWKKIIDRCPEIQQALFFQPLPGGFVKPYTYEIDPPEEFMTIRRGHFWAYDDSGPAVDLIRNPFLQDMSAGYENRNEAFERQSYRTTLKKREAFYRDDASWQRMLVVQPPVRQVRACLMGSKRLGSECRLYTNPSGMKLSDLRRRPWNWGLESAKTSPKAGCEVVLVERPRPSADAETEEPDDLGGYEDWQITARFGPESVPHW